eukprot:183285-Hanusia_phi.AAC.1
MLRFKFVGLEAIICDGLVLNGFYLLDSTWQPGTRYAAQCPLHRTREEEDSDRHRSQVPSQLPSSQIDTLIQQLKLEFADVLADDLPEDYNIQRGDRHST